MKTTNEVKHTPTPWHIDGNGLIMSANPNLSIHSVVDDTGISEADAAFIVRAVNSHEALLDATIQALAALQSTDVNGYQNSLCKSKAIAKLKEAIAKAEGKARS